MVGKLLHFGGRRENAEMSNAFSLTGEMCLGSIVLAQNEDIVGSAPSFTKGGCKILGSCMFSTTCTLVFPPLLQIWFGTV